jgi:hypothetical protein
MSKKKCVDAVLDHLRQREPEDVLVEPHGPLHVGAEQGRVVQAPRRRRGPVGDRLQVRRPDPGAFALDVREVGLGHGWAPCQMRKSSIRNTSATAGLAEVRRAEVVVSLVRVDDPSTI